jgi:aspartate aminotransferase-like enzyme
MTLKTINFSTGPVALHDQVKYALLEDPISHRSQEFQALLMDTTNLYKEHFKVKDVFFLTGSGTTANEAMVQQVKMLDQKGLILSNGEFGNRLINQAQTNDLCFSTYIKPFGFHFEYSDIEQLISGGDIRWILFTHCETSTGLINDLESISGLCKKYNCLCFVDCISSVGAFEIDLSNVAMATASSGKGLCGVAGLALVFANIQPKTTNKIPVCLDLTKYNCKVPFTISSNMLAALYSGSKLKLNPNNYECIATASIAIKNLLEAQGLKTFNAGSHVFTIISTDTNEAVCLADAFEKQGLVTSFKSEYLQKNNWLQVALFSIYSDNEMLEGVKRFQSSLSCRLLNEGV